MPIQTNCRMIAATSAAGAPVMAAIRRQMCSVVDKRSASKALTLSIVGWRSGSPPGVRPRSALPPLPILPPGASAAPRVSMVSMRAFQKKWSIRGTEAKQLGASDTETDRAARALARLSRLFFATRGKKRQSRQRGQRLRPGSLHDRGAVVLDGPLTDAEIGSNVLARVPGQHALHDVLLSRREAREVSRCVRSPLHQLNRVVRQFESSLNASNEFLAGDRLFDEIQCARFHRHDRHRYISVAGDHDRRQMMTLIPELLKQFEPAQSRQVRVDQQAFGFVGMKRVKKRLATCVGVDGAAIVFEHGAYRFANLLVIVDDDDPRFARSAQCVSGAKRANELRVGGPRQEFFDRPRQLAELVGLVE